MYEVTFLVINLKAWGIGEKISHQNKPIKLKIAF